MNIGASIENTLKAAFVIGFVYALVNWEFGETQNGDASYFAEKACVDEINDRFNPSTVRVYAINDNNNGYVVRATVTLAKGKPAKVTCLTNTNGGVREVTIRER